MIDPFMVLGPIALLVIGTAVGIATNALVLHMKHDQLSATDIAKAREALKEKE